MGSEITSEAHHMSTCIVSVMHGGDIPTCIFAISCYIALIMLISVSARSCMLLFKGDLQLLGLF